MSVSSIRCYDCHTSTLDTANAIVQPVNHVDGAVQVSFYIGGFTISSLRCTGSCHSKNHSSERW